MIQIFRSIFAIPELRKRIGFTFALLVVYRIGAHIPTPGIDLAALDAFFEASKGTLLGFFDMFSGGALRRLTIFALGIMPYIDAAIILELLKVLGDGTLTRGLTVRAHAVSTAARQKIEAAGGRVEIIA